MQAARIELAPRDWQTRALPLRHACKQKIGGLQTVRIELTTLGLRVPCATKLRHACFESIDRADGESRTYNLRIRSPMRYHYATTEFDSFHIVKNVLIKGGLGESQKYR